MTAGESSKGKRTQVSNQPKTRPSYNRKAKGKGPALPPILDIDSDVEVEDPSGWRSSSNEVADHWRNREAFGHL